MDEPVAPDFGGACIAEIVPALLEVGADRPAWLPPAAHDAEQIVLLCLDGLGWHQLQERVRIAPTLAAMDGGRVTSVAPSTTAAALTSISTGLPPGEHGVVGYRMCVDGAVLNVLRWSVDGRDARERIPPEKVQTHDAFGGQFPVVVTKAEFRDSGFTRAHLDRCRLAGYRVSSTLVLEIGRALAAGEPFVYAYYDGIDKVAHEYGLRGEFDAEVAYVDRLVGDVLGLLPPGAVLVVTADHGQVHVGDHVVALAPEVLAATSKQSGEGRFRWLHAHPGAAPDLLAAAADRYGDVAWVYPRDQLVDEGWFGPVVRDEARARLGDVGLLAREDVSFHDPADTGPYELVGRHGSVTAAEMYVPLLVATAR